MNMKGLFKKKGFFITIGLLLLVLTLGIAYAKGAEVTNDPSVEWVSHTEYWRNDSASTIIRLTNYQGEPYPVDNCSVTILKPDKTTLVQDAPMQESNIPGNWYRKDSLKGQPLGTYEQQVTCTVGGQTISTSNSFHLNPALEQIDTLSQQTAALNLSLSNVSTDLSAQLARTNESIQTSIDGLNTDVSTLVNDVNKSLAADLSRTEEQLVQNLSQAEVEITATVDELGTTVQADISSVNTTLNDALQTTEENIATQLNNTLANLTDQLDTVHNETQWLTNNAMNEEDRADIMNRFDTLESNLSAALQYCDATTNSSPLCQELHNLSSAVDQYNAEQTAYLSSINQTTLNTWELLSGEIKTNIDTMLASLNLIEERTAAINQTTNKILDEMQGEVNARIIT